MIFDNYNHYNQLLPIFIIMFTFDSVNGNINCCEKAIFISNLAMSYS